MAERKGSLIAKSVSKHAGRAKEKFLQNLGKVDRTADEIFDEHLDNFTKQQTNASRLQKEFNNYIRCIRAVQAASKSLYDCINDVYECGWVGQDTLFAQSQNLEMLWQDLSHKLADQVLLPLNSYYAQFPETKKKIDKRSRKLVDYDGQRHNMQSLEGGGGKKRDEAKIAKAKEQLQQAKRTYDTLNSELHDDLPALYHSRILFLVNNLQTLFSAEQVFHNETSKVYSELEAVIDKLATESQKQSFTSSPKKMISAKENDINSANSPSSPAASGATVENLPSGVLYRVKATHKYNREDVDELSFDAGEIINVVQYDDPEEQEQGWLMGVRELTGEKGMFPANFTRPI